MGRGFLYSGIQRVRLGAHTAVIRTSDLRRFPEPYIDV